MNLLEVRKKFRELSGRYDLVGDNGEDLGANFFIQSGQRYLDRLVETPKSVARTFAKLDAGGYYCTFKNCRAIKEVWAANTDSRWQLEKVDIQWMRANYSSPWTSLSGGEPVCYSPAFLRASPDTTRLKISELIAFVGYLDIMIGANHDYNGVIVAPPTDSEIMLEVWGYFYSDGLSSDSDENFWTVRHPDILIMAAMRAVEIFNRNSTGVKDWELAIASEINTIEKDTIEEDISSIDQMKG